MAKKDNVINDFNILKKAFWEEKDEKLNMEFLNRQLEFINKYTTNETIENYMNIKKQEKISVYDNLRGNNLRNEIAERLGITEDTKEDNAIMHEANKAFSIENIELLYNQNREILERKLDYLEHFYSNYKEEKREDFIENYKKEWNQGIDKRNEAIEQAANELYLKLNYQGSDNKLYEYAREKAINEEIRNVLEEYQSKNIEKHRDYLEFNNNALNERTNEIFGKEINDEIVRFHYNMEVKVAGKDYEHDIQTVLINSKDFKDEVSEFYKNYGGINKETGNYEEFKSTESLLELRRNTSEEVAVRLGESLLLENGRTESILPGESKIISIIEDLKEVENKNGKDVYENAKFVNKYNTAESFSKYVEHLSRAEANRISGATESRKTELKNAEYFKGKVIKDAKEPFYLGNERELHNKNYIASKNIISENLNNEIKEALKTYPNLEDLERNRNIISKDIAKNIVEREGELSVVFNAGDLAKGNTNEELIKMERERELLENIIQKDIDLNIIGTGSYEVVETVLEEKKILEKVLCCELMENIAESNHLNFDKVNNPEVAENQKSEYLKINSENINEALKKLEDRGIILNSYSNESENSNKFSEIVNSSKNIEELYKATKSDISESINIAENGAIKDIEKNMKRFGGDYELYLKEAENKFVEKMASSEAIPKEIIMKDNSENITKFIEAAAESKFLGKESMLDQERERVSGAITKNKLFSYSNNPEVTNKLETFYNEKEKVSDLGKESIDIFIKDMKDYRETFNKEIINSLEKGEPFWRNKEKAPEVPYNHVTGRSYQGMNAIKLGYSELGKSDPRWMTFDQAKDLGCSVRAGEKGIKIDTISYIDKTTNKPLDLQKYLNLEETQRQEYNKNIVGVINSYTVFNGTQIHGLQKYEEKTQSEIDTTKKDEIKIESLLNNNAEGKRPEFEKELLKELAHSLKRLETGEPLKESALDKENIKKCTGKMLENPNYIFKISKEAYKLNNLELCKENNKTNTKEKGMER